MGTTILLAALAALVLDAPASANYRVGISEQDARTFDQPLWQGLGLKRVRYIVPWDFYRGDGAAEAAAFMDAARAQKQDVLVMFTARRGCYADGKYSRSKICRAPSKAAYTRAFKKFKAAFPWVKTYAPWNEANHVSQPTAKSPKRAADYYAALRANCKGCKILAADVLDQSTVTRWLRSFIRYSKNKGRIWGLHNYKDVNRKQSKGLTSVLKTVPGEVWLTETGGITKFESSGFKRSPARAKSATRYMFRLADRFDSRRKGYKSRLTRLYVYRWWGEPDSTFDSGLVDPDGSKRPAFDEFAKFAKRRLKQAIPAGRRSSASRPATKVRATLVNLYSDTQTRPSSAMRKAMAEAEVGDEQRFEDPQITELCARVAELFGMEAAVFLPSGTMCNQIAFRLHIRPGGDEAILHRRSHPIIAEAGGPAAFAGAMMHPLDTPKGMFTGADVGGALRHPDRYSPRSRLVCVEQTTNMAGGRVWPLEQLRGVVAVAKDAGLRLHMDGARLMNAVVASGVPAADMAAGFDTAWLDFTKGLGAPLGACLAGSAELIEEAWRYKQMIGGALRQAGIVAAGALYALDHNVERLAVDHANAAALARGIAGLDGVTLDPGEVETNIVIFEVDDPGRVCAALERAGVRMGVVGERQIRAVTHLDVDADGVHHALQALRRVLEID